MHIYHKNQIDTVINAVHLMDEIEKGLIYQSEGQVITSPIGFLQFNSPPGDVHIKSCAIVNGEFYVVKIASGFYHNPLSAFSSSNGLMLLFSQKTGALQTILLDEGKLTDLRTALTGSICAKYLAPKNIECIGIVGTGIQAKQQLLHLPLTTSCRKVIIWGRNRDKSLAFTQDPELSSFDFKVAHQIEELTQHCRLIVTTTPSTSPLLFGHQILPGTHITAVGADSLGKQELDSTIFQKADLIAVDSLLQCLEYGDLSHAKNAVQGKLILELGALIKAPIKRQEHWITIADLTGVAIEDLQIATTILHQLQQKI